MRNSDGNPISISGLSNLLNNPFYVGLIRIRRTNETFKGAHTPIVSPDAFNRVKAVLSGKVCARVQKHSFLFRRLFRCALCGDTLIGERQKGHVYYRCHTRGCHTTGIREDAAKTVLANLLAQAQLTPDEVAELERLIPQVTAETACDRQQKLRGIELQLDSLKNRMDRLVDAYVDQGIDKATFEERKLRLLSDQASLQEAMQRLQSETGSDRN